MQERMGRTREFLLQVRDAVKRIGDLKVERAADFVFGHFKQRQGISRKAVLHVFALVLSLAPLGDQV